jgi:hypothetical protein
MTQHLCCLLASGLVGRSGFEDVMYGSESEVDSEEEQTKGNAQHGPPLKSEIE